MGIVAEVGEGPSRGGRRPIVLEFQDDACVILGVEMGATHVVVALTDLRGRVLASQSREHPVRDDPAGTRRLIAELCQACLAEPAAGAPPPGRHRRGGGQSRRPFAPGQPVDHRAACLGRAARAGRPGPAATMCR